MNIGSKLTNSIGKEDDEDIGAGISDKKQVDFALKLSIILNKAPSPVEWGALGR